jgi:hypothetical protein
MSSPLARCDLYVDAESIGRWGLGLARLGWLGSLLRNIKTSTTTKTKQKMAAAHV